MKTEVLMNWSEVTLSSLKALGEKTLSVLPNILGAILFLLIGWLVARSLSFVVMKGLRLLKFDNLKDKLISPAALNRANLDFVPSKIAGRFVYWTVLLLFFILASDILGWNAVSRELGGIIRYLPRLFSGLLIFGAGVLIANFIKQSLYALTLTIGMKAGRLLSDAAYYIIIVVLAITALNQIGVDTSVINSNITIIIGSVFFAFALSFALGSKDLLHSIISGLYSKSNFKVGQEITIDDISGKILKIDRISIILETKEGKMAIPINDLITKQVLFKDI